MLIVDRKCGDSDPGVRGGNVVSKILSDDLEQPVAIILQRIQLKRRIVEEHYHISR